MLGKNPATTVVVIDEVDTDNWGIGGKTVTDLRASAKNKLAVLTYNNKKLKIALGYFQLLFIKLMPYYLSILFCCASACTEAFSPVVNDVFSRV